MLSKIKESLIKPEIIVIIVSLAITCAISTVIGTAWWVNYGEFWPGFTAAVAIQIVGFAIWNSYLLRKDAIDSTNLIIQQSEALAKASIQLTCAYCKIPAVVPINLNEENRFKCDGCGQVNSIKMQFFAAQITTPLERIIQPFDESIKVTR